MKKRNIFIYPLISVSIGFLLYNYLFSDVRYGMMGHHYGYYDGYSSINYYLNSALMIISYTVIIIGTIMLFSRKTQSNNNPLAILDERLSKGDISIEEYQAIKKELL